MVLSGILVTSVAPECDEYAVNDPMQAYFGLSVGVKFRSAMHPRENGEITLGGVSKDHEYDAVLTYDVFHREIGANLLSHKLEFLGGIAKGLEAL